jgi:Zn-dependent dipeptidase, microsomal dipeptidase homolog
MNYNDLHKDAFVLDSHCDTPMMLMDGVSLDKRLDKGHIDYVRLKEGGVDAAFFAIYTSALLEPDTSTTLALRMIAKTYDSVKANSDKVAFAFSAEDALNNKKKGLISIFLGMENGSPIQTDLSLLRLFYDLGIRYLTLCHTRNNDICDSCAPKEKRWGGLSPFGKEIVKEMNRLGLLIDVSHVSDDTFYDALNLSTKPIVATHSCCRAIANHPRNLTNQMIKDLAAKGGVIQMNFYPAFLNSIYAEQFWPLSEAFEEATDRYKAVKNSDNADDVEKCANELKKATENMMALGRPSYKEVIDHIDHIVNLVGVEHVGLGSDFDGIDVTPDGLESVDKLPIITKELLERGYKENDIRLILGENFLRVMRQQ